MKIIFTILLITFCLNVFSQQNYYVDSVAGSDGNSGSIGSPWKTVTKANALLASWVSGDSLFFKSGETFPGTIAVTSSGTSGHPVYIGSYGTGAKPVISGFYRLSGWTSVGGGIWSASCASCQANTQLVTFAGNLQGMGRWPNSGYRTISGFSGTSYIIDASLTGTPSWTGASVYIRKNSFTGDVGPITLHDVDTLYYTSPTSNTPTNGYGYIIENSLAALDTLGEWYEHSGTMNVYFGSDTTPVVKVGVLDSLLSIASGVNYVTVNGLSFQGSNEFSGTAYNNSHIRLINCTGKYNDLGFYASSLTHSAILSDSMSYFNDYAVNIAGSSKDDTISNNTTHCVGNTVGMGLSGSSYTAIAFRGDSSRIERNVGDSSGYQFIFFSGSVDTVRYNYGNTFLYLLDDGGIIYSAEDSGAGYVNRYIGSNTVSNGIGASAGTNQPTFSRAIGIYIDQYNTSIEVDSNSCFNNSLGDIYVHCSQNVGVKYNTVYGPTERGTIQIDYDGAAPNYPVRNLNMKYNVSLGDTAFSVVVRDAFADSVGSIDSNYILTTGRFISTAGTNAPLFWYNINGGSPTLINLTSWEFHVQGDFNSSLIQPTGAMSTNPTGAITNVPIAPLYEIFDLYGNRHVVNFPVQPYSTSYLFTKQYVFPVGLIHKLFKNN